MLNYLATRVALLIPTAIGIVAVTFCLLLLIPGDPASVLLGPQATPQAIAQLRSSMHLDDPWYIRLVDYYWALLHGDMGFSAFQNQPVTTIILGRLGATLELAIAAMLIAIVLGLFLGVIAAVKQGSIVDTGAMLLAQLGVSVPVYWLSLLLMLLFAVTLGWLPAIGRGAPVLDAIGSAVTGQPQVLGDSLAHLLLPALALGAYTAAVISRLVRTAMIEILQEDFVRTAQAKGLRRPRILIRHVLRNALLTVISVIGLRFGNLLGGAVLAEAIFGWPGLGQLTVTALSQRDIPLIQGIVLTFAILFALVNLVVDLLYGVIDPRIRLR